MSDEHRHHCGCDCPGFDPNGERVLCDPFPHYGGGHPLAPPLQACPPGQFYSRGQCFDNPRPGGAKQPAPAATEGDLSCVTTGRIPGGKNPITGVRYPAVDTGFCCGGGAPCFSWRHEDAS